jgi:hypothetical protein
LRQRSIQVQTMAGRELPPSVRAFRDHLIGRIGAARPNKGDSADDGVEAGTANVAAKVAVKVTPGVAAKGAKKGGDKEPGKRTRAADAPSPATRVARVSRR